MDITEPVPLDVVRGWVNGWAVSRGLSAPVDEPGAFRVDVGAPGQLVRYVLPDPDPAVVRRFADTLVEPGTWLKVCGPVAEVSRLLRPAWIVREPEYLMVTTTLGTRLDPPPEYEISLVRQEDVVRVMVRSADGGIAAEGQAALCDSVAVIDQVATALDHRRRGLGRLVMSHLGAAATEAGATTGLLVATVEGRALYSTLGWSAYSEVTAAFLPARRLRGGSHGECEGQFDDRVGVFQ